MNPAHRFAPLLAAVLGIACSSCVTHVFRHAEPARVERVGLDATDDDLVMLQVVHGLYPRHKMDFVVAVPHGWEHAACTPRDDGRDALTAPLALRCVEAASERERRIVRRDTTRWPADARALHRLLGPQDLPPDARRNYVVVNLRRPDGAVDVELRVRRGTDTRELVLGRFTLPAECTPRELSTLSVCLLTPPLAVVDAVWITASAASAVLLLPFGSYQLFAAEPVD